MASEQLYTARPQGTRIIATNGSLKNLANSGIARSDEVANGTSLKLDCDMLLYLHDFAAAPTAGGYFEAHIVYSYLLSTASELMGDGEHGDLDPAGAPNLTSNTRVGIFNVKASDDIQVIPLNNILIRPHDFRVCLINKCGQAIANTDGSFLEIFLSSQESQ